MDSVHRDSTAAGVGVSSPCVGRCEPSDTMAPNRQMSSARSPSIPLTEPGKEYNENIGVLLYFRAAVTAAPRTMV